MNNGDRPQGLVEFKQVAPRVEVADLVLLDEVVATSFELEGFKGKEVELTVGRDQEMVGVLEIGGDRVKDEGVNVACYLLYYVSASSGHGSSSLEVGAAVLQ